MVTGDCLYEENVADYVELSQTIDVYRNGSNDGFSYNGILSKLIYWDDLEILNEIKISIEEWLFITGVHNSH